MNTKLVRAALRGNAAFSTISGIALIAGADALAPAMGIPSPLALRITGALLLPFALSLFQNARRAEIRGGEAWAAVAMDAGWVAGSLFLVLADPLALTGLGRCVVLAVAAIVATFAVLQAQGLRGSDARPAAQAR